MYKNKFLLFFLCFMLVCSFICVTIQRSHAIAVAGSLAALYGMSLGTKLLAFVLCCAAAGITYKTVLEAKRMFDKYMSYDWGNYDPENTPPDDPKSDKDWKSIIKGLLAGVVSLGFMNNIKSFFQSLGSDVGDNQVGETFSGSVNGITYSYYMQPSQAANRYGYRWWFSVNGSPYYEGHGYRAIGGVSHLEMTDITFVVSGTDVVIDYSYTAYPNQYPIDYLSFVLTIPDVVVPGVPNNYDYSIPSYHVQPYSPVVTNTTPSMTMSPDLVSILPLEEVIAPDGKVYYMYSGTQDDLIDDLVNNVTFDDLVTSVEIQEQTGIRTYDITETPTGLVIYPEIEDNEEPLELPYPDIDIVPIEDVPEYQGQSIGLLQNIINWIVKLINTVIALPSKFVNLLKELMLYLFVPEPYFIQDKVMSINTIISTKVGDPNYVNFLDNVKSLQGEPIPDGYIWGYKCFDASYINNLADTAKLWQRWFWYILITLWYMNNTYKLIRGSNAVDFNAYDGGSSGGGKIR